MQLQILTAAQDARIWAEERALRELFPADLRGLCARSSAILYLLLRQQGYTPQLVYSSAIHTFVTVKSHIVDVTATQFFNTNFIPIFITPIKSVQFQAQYRHSKTFDNIFQFVRFQNKDNWRKKEIFSRRDIVSFNKMKESNRYVTISNKIILERTTIQ